MKITRIPHKTNRKCCGEYFTYVNCKECDKSLFCPCSLKENCAIFCNVKLDETRDYAPDYEHKYFHTKSFYLCTECFEKLNY